MDAKGMGGKAKVQPGVRFERDRDRLWKGSREGTIKTVGTDGLTYSAQFKESEGFWDCRQGVNIQVIDTLALLYDEGVNRRRLDLPTVVQVVSENAAKILRLYPRKGAIVQGADAIWWCSTRRRKRCSANIDIGAEVTIRFGRAGRSKACP
jgi:dihydroorotase-like cyclic amidohydrolase